MDLEYLVFEIPSGEIVMTMANKQTNTFGKYAIIHRTNGELMIISEIIQTDEGFDITGLGLIIDYYD